MNMYFMSLFLGMVVVFALLQNTDSKNQGALIPPPPDMNIYDKIRSVELNDGRMEIIKESLPTYSMDTSMPGNPYILRPLRSVWKEIYEAKNGRIVLREVIHAKVIPAQEERIEWPK